MVTPATKGVAPGRDALIKALAAHWASRMPDGSDVLDYPRSSLNWLAVPVSKAFEMVGYGQRLSDGPTSSKAVLQNDRLQQGSSIVAEEVERLKQAGVGIKLWFPEWTGERLLERKQQLIAQGIRNYAVRLEQETGVPQRDVRRRIEEHEEQLNPTVMLNNAWNASAPQSRVRKALSQRK